MIIMGKDDNGKSKSSSYTILSQEELAEGKTTEIIGLEITGDLSYSTSYVKVWNF